MGAIPESGIAEVMKNQRAVNLAWQRGKIKLIAGTVARLRLDWFLRLPAGELGPGGTRGIARRAAGLQSKSPPEIVG
jgi:hypothetical protein